jgi:excisionase family DNA binding protein
MHSVTELAQVLNMSRQAVLKRIKAGHIKAVQIGKSFVITDKEFKQAQLKTRRNYPERKPKF